jgi:phage shock protein C
MTANTTTRLERPLHGRVLGGVCAAIARRFGLGTTLVRVLAVASIILPGPQVIIYVICWIVIPSEQRPVVITPAV